MNRSSLKNQNWQLKRVSRFEIWFFPLFFIGLGASVGVAYGWSTAFDETTSVKRDFSFIGFITGLVLFLLTMQDINQNRVRFGRFLKIIARYNTLVDVIFENINEPVNLTSSVIPFSKNSSVNPIQYLNAMNLVKEALLGALTSMMMLIWQLEQSASADDALQEKQIGEIAKNVIFNMERDSTGQILAYFDRDLNSGYRDPIFGIILIDIILVRLQKMSTSCIWIGDAQQPIPQSSTNGFQMIVSYQTVASQIHSLKQDIKELEYQGDIKQWWWFSFAVKAMGLLYAFLIPPAYFAVLGKNIIYVGPFMFMFLGGLVLINICLGDPFLHPTNKQMGHVYVYVHDSANKIQRKFSARFLSESNNNITPPSGLQSSNNGNTILANATRQIQLLQQKVSSFELQSLDKQLFDNSINEWFSNAEKHLSSTKNI